MERIAFINNKGGVLKTSLCVNYAAVLAKKGKKVLIIDTDSQNNVSLNFGKQLPVNTSGLFGIIFQEKDWQKEIVNLDENIDLLPPGNLWKNYEWIMAKKIESGEFLNFRSLVNKIAKLEQYDYLLFDTEPKRSLNTFNVLLATKLAIIPFSLDVFGVKGLLEMQNYLNEAKTKNTELKVKAYVATKTRSRSKAESYIRSLLENILEKPGLAPIEIPNSIIAINALTFNQKPVVNSSKSKLAIAYKNLVEFLETENLETKTDNNMKNNNWKGK